MSKFYIPIIWRFLFREYVKVFLLCTSAFIVVLMTIKLNEIVQFASFGASGAIIAQFSLNQMAAILPYSLPIACFISAIILIKRLSTTHELTALRSAGLAFKDIFTPIILTAALLTLVNFLLVSEVATQASLSNILLKEKLRAVNPLILIHNKHLMKLKGIHFFTLGPSKIGEYATEAIVAMPNRANTHLHLLLAKTIESDGEQLICDRMTLITNLGAESDEQYDKLVVENIAKSITPSAVFSPLFRGKGYTPTLRGEQLSLRSLLADLTKKRSYTELIRRFSSGLSVFTFTFMGLAFGVSISRYQTRKSLIIAISLIAAYLIAHLIAKEFKDQLLLSSLLYLLPHLFVFLLSLWALSRMNKGIET